MALLISNGRFIIAKDNKFVSSNRPYIEYAFGGTATGVAVSFVNSTKQAQYKAELASSYSSERLASSKIVRLCGETSGTVTLKIVKQLADKGEPLELLLRKSDGTWVSLYDDYVPNTGIVTVTVTEFGPVIGIPQVDFLMTKDNLICYDSEDNLLVAKEEEI